jgi:hypothetical protein
MNRRRNSLIRSRIIDIYHIVDSAAVYIIVVKIANTALTTNSYGTQPAQNSKGRGAAV